MEPTSFWERFKPAMYLYLKVTAIGIVVSWFIALFLFIFHR